MTDRERCIFLNGMRVGLFLREHVPSSCSMAEVNEWIRSTFPWPLTQEELEATGAEASSEVRAITEALRDIFPN